MERFLMTYREVIPDQTNSEQWREIVLNTGATQSTLQDIKVAEKAGGYCFKTGSSKLSRNRFIYWRTSHDVLELSEISFDLNLCDNQIRYKFTDAPVLALSIDECQQSVIILVATVSSLHRLQFIHPSQFDSYEARDAMSCSIFKSANGSRDSSNFFAVTNSTNASPPIPHTAACYLTSNGEQAFFALGYQNALQMFVMNCETRQTTVTELRSHNMMPRLLLNVTEALRGKNTVVSNQFTTSLVFATIGDKTYLYALYRDDTLRMWSTEKGKCLASINRFPDNTDPRPPGPQTSSLCRALENSLCAFFSHSTGSEFVIIKTHFDNLTPCMIRTSIIPAPHNDLIAFEVSESKIWGLWCNSQGEFDISSFPLTPGNGMVWISAALEPPPDRYSVTVEDGTEPEQAYCSYIFHPGKFQQSVIVKALAMFRRSNIIFEKNIPLSLLRERVCQAVSTEIQNDLKSDVDNDDYTEIANRCWENFFSCCEQYHLKACQPIGLFVLDSMGGVTIVKKNIISLLRPCELLEHLMLSGDKARVEDLVDMPLALNEQTTSDLVQIVSVLSFLEKQLSDDVKMNIDRNLYQLQPPNVIVSQLVSKILSKETPDEILFSNHLAEIRQQMQNISNLPVVLCLLLDALRMENTDHHDAENNSYNDGSLARVGHSLGNLFNSNLGLSLVAESLHQIALVRYSLCRNLLILEHILIETFALACDTLEIVRSRCMPETVVFLQAYYVMVWLCETPIDSSQSLSTLEASTNRLAMLHIVDNRQCFTRTMQPASVLEYFLRSRGMREALLTFSSISAKTQSNEQWQNILLPLVTIVKQLVWAASGSFTFGGWLIGTCQHNIIQEYVRLLNSWCEWNNCSRHFILALSLLETGDASLSYDLFVQASKGVFIEPFFFDTIVSDNRNLSPNHTMAQYYLKTIQLFEHYGHLKHVIMLAQTAIGLLQETDPQLAMFQSIVFSKHLELQQFEEAYHSLVYNADPIRRKDCLRQLVSCLFDKKRLDLLIHFPYIGLQNDFENIIESRARSLSVHDNVHYDFLYAYHVTKENMRKASSIMYEKAMRLKLESESLAAWQTRYNALLNCMNCLQLVVEEYAWIAKPEITEDNVANKSLMSIDHLTPLKQTHVVVLQIKDVKQELLLTEAVLYLATHRHDFKSIINAGAEELVTILSTNGLYSAAIKLANGFDLNVAFVLEHLTSACIRAANEGNEAWSWIQENDIADLSLQNCAADMAWSFLRKLLIDAETQSRPNSKLLKKCITKKILAACEFVPLWLYNSYKAVNPSEMLQLYVSHNRLIEATDLAKEFIMEMLEAGNDSFGDLNSITIITPPLCFPINTIDQLLHLLSHNQHTDEEYKISFDELHILVDEYKKKLIRVSNDRHKLQMERTVLVK